MECTFQVGDRVVCKQRPPICPHCIDRRLEDGVVYTVKAVHVFPSGVICPHGRQYPASPTIRVKELASRAPNDFGHYAWHFRPVKPLSFWLGEKQELRTWHEIHEGLPVRHAHHIGALASASISECASTAAGPCQGVRSLGAGPAGFVSTGPCPAAPGRS